MRAFCLRATLAGFLIPSSVAGAQSMALTESEAVARLSPDSPRVRAIRAAIDIARADVLAASRWPNPRITFNRESVAGVTEHMTMVLQPLPITGRRGLETNAASALLDASTGRADEEVRRARADLRLAFTQLVTAEARERELTRARDDLRDLSDILTKREAAGDAAGFDRLRSEREVLDLEADLVASGADRARAQATVVAFFSASIDPSTIVAAEPVRARLAIPSVDALMEIAETARGELVALRRDVEAARFAERAAERRRIPEPEVIMGTKSSTVAGGDVGSVMGIQAQIPLFDRARSERAASRARLMQAQARLDGFRIALRSQLTGLRAVILDRREGADRYRASAVNSADQIERIAQVSYDAGERGILELLDAYRTAASARVRQVALDAAVREAEIELEFASGWEMP
jgi:cobalt-zinc-cadmium efflux system outer membrane protein